MIDALQEPTVNRVKPNALKSHTRSPGRELGATGITASRFAVK